MDEKVKQLEQQIFDLEIKKNKAEIRYRIGLMDVNSKEKEIRQYDLEQIKLWEKNLHKKGLKGYFYSKRSHNRIKEA